MNRTIAIVCLLATVIYCCFPTFPAVARQPNIILILADDLGYETIRANGGESYETPNLDRLAAAGIRFTECYVQPVCTPTRVELMTGISNVRNYIRFGEIDPKATTFAQLLKDAGYATGIAGKWQLGRVPELPRELGFDESCLWQHTRRPPRYANPGLEYNGQERDFNNGEYGPDLVNDFALDFITRHKDSPFLLYYPMMLTHAPFQPTPDSADWDATLYGEEGKRDVKHFGEMVTYMDKLVGTIVARVDELGLRDDTLILFVGDNGTGVGITSRFNGTNYPGGKGQSTARGMHVPLIVSWPGHIPAGRVDNDLVSSVDFLPTLCEAAGVKVPGSLSMDGQSFLPQALGEKGTPREWLYSWYSRDGGTEPESEFAMTTTRKLHQDGRFFNLTTDPFEEGEPQREGNLSGEDAAVAKQLRATIEHFAGARPAELGGLQKARRAAAKGQRRAAKNANDE